MMMTRSVFGLDPDNPGWIRGWAVLREAPWDLQGMHPTEEAARLACEQLQGYVVKYGARKLGSNDFIAE